MKKQAGFSHILLLLILMVLAVVGFAGWRVVSNKKSNDQPKNDNASELTSLENNEEIPTELAWLQTEDGWRAGQNATTCPDLPMLKMPVDIEKVTAVLYPGQTRGGNYKPHGGFRFDNNSNSVPVEAPLDGFVIRGSHYIEEGEVQYMFDVMNNCGVMYRLDHLRKLSDKFTELTKSWPAPQVDDSRTNKFDKPIYVKTGEVFATEVGFANNTSFDLGVYDYRQQNEASKAVSYQNAHSQDKELSWYAVCWLDWLDEPVENELRAMPPGDSTSGRNSDYCK